MTHETLAELGKAIPWGKPIAIPDRLSAWLGKTKPLWIDGKTVASGSTFDDVNPATETALAQIALAGEKEVDAAVVAARTAFEDGRWSRMTLAKRAEHIGTLADLIDLHRP